MQLARRPLWKTIQSSSCIACQWRSFGNSYRRNAEKETTAPVTPPPPSPLEDAPRAYGKAVEEFTPKPLGRPIGLLWPPNVGENTGTDTRTWKEKRDDFTNYDKHIAKRKQLTQKISAPYFREWSNMRHHKGKTFLAPPRLFKAEYSLFFPNLQGETLVSSKGLCDTTAELEDHVSVVSIYSSAWAERQALSFVAPKHNPELHELVKESKGLAQFMQINVEENALKAMLVKLFMGSLRKRIPEQDWGRYFLVKRGMTDEIRDAIGLLNSKVGYTYVLDGACRIRWAGSGICEPGEKEGLVKGVRRLIEEAKTSKSVKLAEALRKKQLQAAKGKEVPNAKAAVAA